MFLLPHQVTKKPVSWFLDHSNLWQQQDSRNGETREQKEQYLSNDYRYANEIDKFEQVHVRSSDHHLNFSNVFHLVTHHERMSSVENFHRAVFAIFLLRCLQSQGYFSGSAEGADQLTKDHLVIAKLLFHFLEVLQFNTHEVAQLEMRGRKFEEGAKSQLIGAAVYPTLALFNHSCEPSLTR